MRLYMSPNGSSIFTKYMKGVSGITEYPNVEAEILAPKIFDLMGIHTLDLTVCNDEVGFFLKMPDINTGTKDAWTRLLDDICLFEKIYDTTIANMLAVDILIGNADRSFANVYTAEKCGKYELLPIDHNLAFLSQSIDVHNLTYLGFIPSFKGIDVFSVKNKYEAWFMARCGTVSQIIDNSSVYSRFKSERVLNDAKKSLHNSCVTLVSKLSDSKIMDFVSAICPKDIVENSMRRENELIEILI